MKILAVLTSVVIGLYGCASHIKPYKGTVSCQDNYANLSSRYNNILKKYQTAPSDVQSALTDLEKDLFAAAKHCEYDPQILTLIADVEISRGDNGKALYFARHAESIAPDMMEANYILGNVLTLVGDYNSGLAYIEKASRLAPDSIFIQENLCSNYEMAKLFQRAIDVCTKVIDSGEPKVLGAALYVRARAYKALGCSDKAEVDFNKSKAGGYDGEKYYSKEHLEGGRIE